MNKLPKPVYTNLIYNLFFLSVWLSLFFHCISATSSLQCPDTHNHENVWLSRDPIDRADPVSREVLRHESLTLLCPAGICTPVGQPGGHWVSIPPSCPSLCPSTHLMPSPSVTLTLAFVASPQGYLRDFQLHNVSHYFSKHWDVVLGSGSRPIHTKNDNYNNHYILLVSTPMHNNVLFSMTFDLRVRIGFLLVTPMSGAYWIIVCHEWQLARTNKLHPSIPAEDH